MIKILKKNLLTILLLTIYNIPIKNFSSTTTTQKNSSQEPMYNTPFPISEAELESIMKSIVEEYKQLPEEEKLAIAKEFGIPLEVLEQNMNEAETLINKSSQEKNTRGTFDKQQNNTFENNTKTFQQEKYPSSTKASNEQNNLKKQTKKALQNIQLFLTKIEDHEIKNIILTNNNENIIAELEIFHYYGTIIEEKNIYSTMKDIKPIIEKINSLETNINNIIPLSEHINKQMENNLFTKYNIRGNKQEKLIDKIKEILAVEEEKLLNLKDNLRNDQDKKIKSQIAYTENKITILEQDLIEAQTNAIDNSSKNINEAITMTERAVLYIINELQSENIKNMINILEETIKKNIPEEIKNGKKKEQEIITKLKKEQALYEQKGSQGTPTNENIRTTQYQNQDTNKENNNYKYQSSNQKETNTPIEESEKSKDTNKDANNNNEQKSNKKLNTTKENDTKDKEINKLSSQKQRTDDAESYPTSQTRRNKTTDESEKLEKDKHASSKTKNNSNENTEWPLLNEIDIITKSIQKQIQMLKENQSKETEIKKLDQDTLKLQILIKKINFDNIITNKTKFNCQLIIEKNEDPFLKYISILEQNQKTSDNQNREISEDQKIMYELFILRNDLLSYYKTIGETNTSLYEILRSITNTLEIFIKNSIDAYKKASKKIPFWLEEWHNITNIEEILTKNIQNQTYPITPKKVDTTDTNPTTQEKKVSQS